MAHPGEVPVINGPDIVAGKWELLQGKIYETNIEMGLDIEQVFVDGQMMTWARWPNATFDDRWKQKKWQATGKGCLLVSECSTSADGAKYSVEADRLHTYLKAVDLIDYLGHNQLIRLVQNLIIKTF